MQTLQNILLQESKKSADREIRTTIEVINKVYNDWKKTGRRKNAIDLVASSVNRLSVLSPTVLDHTHDASVMKVAFIIMRCMELSVWKDISMKEKLYKKLYPFIDKVQHIDVQTGTGGTLREIIMTRLSASISYNDVDKLKVFVCYEPKMPRSYLEYLFHQTLPEKTVKMSALPLPESFSTLEEILKINHKKAKSALGITNIK